MNKDQINPYDDEALLNRHTVACMDEAARAFYRGKVILVSGGGGSIGSELCRQLAACAPRKLVVLDIYENGAYELEQELRIAHSVPVEIEIASVCSRTALDAIFRRHRPDIVLHAAAHKHVPLMERNCCEAVRNNVFGTHNMIGAAEASGVGRFTLISTDKAVNPTSVMGATKRMCEMLVQSRTDSRTIFSAVRFGNVLGSNGSVIPLFRRQIAQGGPVTVTDKRITRYFMTIPEAAQLVLQSGAMAKNGELYVLDMGKPVSILALAEQMIRLAGKIPYRDIDIVETGLRPGEKLYEELLIESETLTENRKILIERDTPQTAEAIAQKLAVLSDALVGEDDAAVKAALKTVVDTYRDPEEVNEGV